MVPTMHGIERPCSEEGFRLLMVDRSQDVLRRHLVLNCDLHQKVRTNVGLDGRWLRPDLPRVGARTGELSTLHV